MCACGLNCFFHIFSLISPSSASSPKDATFVMKVMIILGGSGERVETGKLYLTGQGVQQREKV